MRKILFAVILFSLFLSVGALADIKFTSDYEVVKGPSIVHLDGQFYIAYADKDKDVILMKVKLRTTGGQYIAWLDSADVAYSTDYIPDVAIVGGDVVLGFTKTDGNVFLAKYNTDLDLVGSTEYQPTSKYGASVAGWKGHVLNSWTSDKKPGLTIIGTDISKVGDYNNLCDLRYSDYEPKSEAKVACFGDTLAVVWTDGDKKIHITCFALEYSAGKINIGNIHDTKTEEKTKLSPVCAFNDDGELCVSWASEDSNYIFINYFTVSTNSDAVSLRKDSIKVDGCLGLDVCATEGKTYIAYAGSDGLLVISKF